MARCCNAHAFRAGFWRFSGLLLSILSKLQMLSATPPHFILCILAKVESYIRDAHGLSYSRSFITWHEITKSYSSPEIFIASWYFMDFTNPIAIVTCKTLCKYLGKPSNAQMGKPSKAQMGWTRWGLEQSQHGDFDGEQILAMRTILRPFLFCFCNLKLIERSDMVSMF